MTRPKQKVAILGGGLGAVSAAYGLTSAPNWQDYYDITIYQLGWRLGGKAASGRNQDIANRIEEHGLHILFGYYQNAFEMIQQCYKEAERPATMALQNWTDAFTRDDYIGVMDYNGYTKTWSPWMVHMPPNERIPGQGEHYMTLFSILDELLGFLIEFQKGALEEATSAAAGAASAEVAQSSSPGSVNIWSTIVSVVPRLLGDIRAKIQELDKTAATDEIKTRLGDLKSLLTRLLEDFIRLFNKLERWFKPAIESHNTLRRLVLMLEWTAVSILGFIEDDVFTKGLDAIDDTEYRAWLTKYGACDLVTGSSLVQALYDYIIAYPNGDAGSTPEETCKKGDLGAGVANRCLLMTFFGYSGSIMWKMNAGMGDIIFGPVYVTLKKRGVKFEFFTKITDLKLTDDGNDIKEIVYDRQVTLKLGAKEYNPLYNIDVEENGQTKTLPVWPAEPLYAQLEQGEELQKKAAAGENVNLESAWTQWTSVKPHQTLVKGVDFDIVVLGIAVAALADMTSGLMAQSSAWKDMINNANTTQVLASQLWLSKDLKSLGWLLPSHPPVIDAYVEPFNTWASMDQTLWSETWPADHTPMEIAYFCGPLKDADPIPPFTCYEFPKQQNVLVQENMLTWLKSYISGYWPHFDLSMLVALASNPTDEERYKAQYWLADVNPTRRYVCSAHNTIQYRLPPGKSGFNNLYLAGDWTLNGFNYGAVEPTVISGLQASQAISGYPVKLLGENHI